jgi:hypothetical protein
MSALILALGFVVGVVTLACQQKEDPTIRRFLEKRRLGILASKPDRVLTRSEAEDGLALAMRHDDKKLVKRFGRLVASLKTHGSLRRTR